MIKSIWRDPLLCQLWSSQEMKKWFLIMLIIALLAFGSVIGFNLFIKNKIDNAIAHMPEAVYPITAMTLKPGKWEPAINAIGFIEPNKGVTVANEASGIIKSIDFENGVNVKCGDLLVSLDARVEKANLKAKEVQLPAIESDYKRLNRLFQKGSVSSQKVDNANSKYQTLLADIESLKATIDQKEIRAPFSGIVGIRAVSLGQYLQVGSNIVRLEDISSMKLRFTIPQDQLSKIKIGQKVRVNVDAYPNDLFEGRISAIEPAVFYQSGLVQVQATIPNNHDLLRSGMFAKVSVVMPELTKQLVIPQTAINMALYGDSIYIVRNEQKDGKTEKHVKQMTIKVLDRDGNNALIQGDIKAGDTIVTSGLVRLSNGSLVKIVKDNALKLPAKMPTL